MKKYNKTNYSHLLDHYTRYGGNYQYVKFGNREINTALTHLNYSLVNPTLLVKNQLRDRVKMVDDQYKKAGGKVPTRKDRIIMIGCVIDCPAELVDTGREDEFFQLAYQWQCELFGKENVIECVVHKDEVHAYFDPMTNKWETSRWHMHSAVVPVIKDEVFNADKILAKEFTSRAKLTSYHRDLDDYIYKSMGVHTLTGNPENKITGQKTEDLKERSARAAYDKEQEAIRNEEEANALAEKTGLLAMKKAETNQEIEFEDMKRKTLIENQERLDRLSQETKQKMAKEIYKQKEMENKTSAIQRELELIEDEVAEIKVQHEEARRELEEIQGDVLSEKTMKAEVPVVVKGGGLFGGPKREVAEIPYKEYADLRATVKEKDKIQKEYAELDRSYKQTLVKLDNTKRELNQYKYLYEEASKWKEACVQIWNLVTLIFPALQKDIVQILENLGLIESEDKTKRGFVRG